MREASTAVSRLSPLASHLSRLLLCPSPPLSSALPQSSSAFPRLEAGDIFRLMSLRSATPIQYGNVQAKDGGLVINSPLVSLTSLISYLQPLAALLHASHTNFLQALISSLFY